MRGRTTRSPTGCTARLVSVKTLILHGVFCGFRDDGRLPTDPNPISRHDYRLAMMFGTKEGATESADVCTPERSVQSRQFDGKANDVASVIEIFLTAPNTAMDKLC
jgi:hypothetical protein